MSSTDTDRSNHAEENARAWAVSIVTMVTRYEHASRCTEARPDCEALPEDVWDALDLDPDRDATDEEWSAYHDEADAEQRISESVLEVQVRGDWHTPGEHPRQEAEFEILLTTGGPACRIVGELDHPGEPRWAWLEHQDWGTPWTPLAEGRPPEGTLLAFASHFLYS